MRASYYAERIRHLLFTAQQAQGGTITLTPELSQFVVNEMFCLCDDIRLLENTIVPDDVRNMPVPVGENVVNLKDFMKKGK